MSAVWFVRIVMLLMFVLPGILSLWVGVSGKPVVLREQGAGFWRRRLGLRGARVVYVVLGVLLLGCGVIFMLDPLGVMGDISPR